MNDHIIKVNYSITLIQDKLSVVIYNTIHINSGICSTSNPSSLLETSSFCTSSNKSVNSKSTNSDKNSLKFFTYIYFQNILSSSETHLSVVISNLIIYEILSFYIAQTPSFSKVLDLVRNVSKCYNPPNSKIVSKDLLDVIHDQNTKRKLTMIKKRQMYLDFYFLIMVPQSHELHCLIFFPREEYSSGRLRVCWLSRTFI